MQLLALLFAVAVAASRPQCHTGVKPWSPAESSDSRSPCPMLNTLANHGYLPHDGKQITEQQISEALAEAVNYNPGDGLLIAQFHFARLNQTVIDLEDLNTNGLNEHDASNTREDFPDDTLHVNKDRVDAMLDDSTTDYLDVVSLARTRSRVEALAPPLTAAFKAQADGETAFILQIMNDGPALANGTSEDWRKLQAPKDRVEMWMKNEQLPAELGWKAPVDQFRFTVVGPIGNEIAAAQTS